MPAKLELRPSESVDPSPPERIDVAFPANTPLETQRARSASAGSGSSVAPRNPAPRYLFDLGDGNSSVVSSHFSFQTGTGHRPPLMFNASDVELYLEIKKANAPTTRQLRQLGRSQTPKFALDYSAEDTRLFETPRGRSSAIEVRHPHEPDYERAPVVNAGVAALKRRVVSADQIDSIARDQVASLMDPNADQISPEPWLLPAGSPGPADTDGSADRQSSASTVRDVDPSMPARVGEWNAHVPTNITLPHNGDTSPVNLVRDPERESLRTRAWLVQKQAFLDQVLAADRGL